jgi:hypothetical protein
LVIKISRHGRTMLYVRLPGKKMIRLTGIESEDDPKFGRSMQRLSTVSRHPHLLPPPHTARPPRAA